MTFPSPRYPSINPTVLAVILARTFHRHRSLSIDSAHLCARIRPPIIYSNLQNIPSTRPLLITTNHYHRPGFNTAWIALALSAVFNQEVHWIMSNEWLFEGSPFAFLLRPIMRFILRSITLSYGFLPMPTMVPGFSTPQERTSGVRAVIEFLRCNPNAILGLTPEGMDSLGEDLRLPPSGAGRFILHLQQMGAVILPAAVFEQNGALHVNFGNPTRLNPPPHLPPSELDRWAREAVMQPIGELLSKRIES